MSRGRLFGLFILPGAVLALACGGVDVDAPGPAAQPTSHTSTSQPSLAASSGGDPLVTQCQQAIACGCPNNPGDTVQSCVQKWQEMQSWGTQVRTIACFAALDCASMCDISEGPGKRCAMMMEQDALAARAIIDQRAHETNMEIIGGMNSPSTEVYDADGVKLYEY